MLRLTDIICITIQRAGKGFAPFPAILAGCRWRCKLIVRCGVGFDNVDHALARERGIVVANVPDYGTEEVADTAIGMMLSLTRGIAFLNSRLRDAQGPWAYSQAAPVWRLRGRTF